MSVYLPAVSLVVSQSTFSAKTTAIVSKFRKLVGLESSDLFWICWELDCSVLCSVPMSVIFSSSKAFSVVPKQQVIAFCNV